jgi:uncharacterized repeat protein (TIGR01451 family)
MPASSKKSHPFFVQFSCRLAASLLLSSMVISGLEGFFFTRSAQSAPSRKDWCGTVWSVENQNTLAWINPVTGLTTSAAGPTTQITMPGGSMGTAVAAIGIHKESGTMFAFDRTGATGTLYKYKFGIDAAWTPVSVSGLLGLLGTQSIAGASNNLNKMTVDGNTLFIAESNGVAVYSIPLNASGSVVGGATVQTYSFVGDPAGTPPHRSSTSTDPTGTEIINGGDIVTDEYGDVYNVTYNSTISYSGTTQVLTTTKAYFYQQDPVTKTWVYQGQTTGNQAFAGAAFYRGDLYVKAGTQLKKVDLTRSPSGYTGWNNALVNIGAVSSTSSADLTACGTPFIALTKTRQVYSDSTLTTLVADQTKVKAGQYIKYSVIAQNVGDAWARSTKIIDNLPIGTVYQPNSATLNGINLALSSYPTGGFSVNSSSTTAGIVRYPSDPDTATLTFAVQVAAISGTITNQATTTYVDNDGLPSDPATCTTTPKVNCATDGGVTVIQTFTASGMVWHDLDGNVTLDGAEAGMNAGSSNLTVYAIGNTGTVVGKATVAPDGTYAIPSLGAGNYTLRLSDDASVALGAPGPVASLPNNWVNTGEDKNGMTETITPGEIAITVVSANVINQNFGVRMAIEPFVNATCQADGLVWVSGGDLGSNQINQIGSYRISNSTFTNVVTTAKDWGDIAWATDNKLYGVEYTDISGGANPSSLHRIDPVTGQTTFITDLSMLGNVANSVSGIPNGGLIIGGDFYSKVYRYELSNATNPPVLWHDFGDGFPAGDFIPFNGKVYIAWNTGSSYQLYEVTVDANYNYVSHRDLGALPDGSRGLALVLNKIYTVAATNIHQITSIPTSPVATIPTTIVPNMPAPYFLGGASGTEEPFGGCTASDPNVLLVKRITAINGSTSTLGGDSLAGYIDAPTNAYDDNTLTIPTQNTPTDPAKDTVNWPPLNTFMLGGINGGNIKPNDEIEYSIYFLSTGDGDATNVLLCDRIPTNVTFVPRAFNGQPIAPGGLGTGDRGILFSQGTTTGSLSNVSDGDIAQYLAPGISISSVYPSLGNTCGTNDNGAIVVNLGTIPKADGPGTPPNSYGFIRFRGRVK